MAVFVSGSHMRAAVLFVVMTSHLVRAKGESGTRKSGKGRTGGHGGEGKPGVTGGLAAEQMLSALRTMCAQSTDDLKKTGAGRKSGIIEACAKIKTNPRKKHIANLMALVAADKPTSKWQCSDWKLMVGDGSRHLRPSQLSAMPDDCMEDIMDDKKLMKKMEKSKKIMRKMVKKMAAAMGDVEGWDADKMRKAQYMVGSMRLAALKKLNSAAVKAALADLKDVKFTRRHLKAAMSRKVMQALGGVTNAQNWTADDIVNSDQFIRTSPRAVAELDPTALKNALKKLGKKMMTRRNAALYARRMRKLPEFQNATKLTQQKLKEMGTLLGSMGLNYLKNIPVKAFVGNLDAIKKSDMSRLQKRVVMKTFSTTIPPETITDLGILGNLVGGLKLDDFKKIPAASFENVTQLKELDLRDSQRLVVLSKLKDSVGLKSVGSRLGHLIKVLSTSELRSLTFDDLGLACNSTDTLDVQVTDVQANVLFDTVKGRMGNANSSYTGACFERWGCFSRRAVSVPFVDELPQTDEIVRIADALTDMSHVNTVECVMRSMPAKRLAEKLALELELTDADTVKALSNDTLAIVAHFVPFIDEKIWLSFTPQQVVAMTPVIGMVRGVSAVTYAKLKDWVLRNTIDESTNKVVDKTKTPTLDGDDLAYLGVLRCYLTPADMARITADAFERNLDDMQSCPYSLEQGKALFKRYAELFPNLLKSKEDIVRGAGILGYISDQSLKNANQEALADSFADVVDALEEKHRMLRQRDFDGFEDELSINDRTLDSVREVVLLWAFFKAIATQEKLTRTKDISPRSRRGTEYEPACLRVRIPETALTCSDIQLAGQAASSFDPALLATLSDTEFTDCVEQLGDIDSWTSGQLTQLGRLAKKAWGQPLHWMPDDIEEAGNIVASLTVDEIGSLNLLDFYTIAAATKSQLFSSEQREIMFATWLGKARNNDTTTLKAADILLLGNLACGATAANIDKIPIAVYKDSTAVWGALDTCGLNQRQAIARKAEVAFGNDPTKWTVTTIREIGAAVVEVNKTTLSSIPVMLFGEIPPKHIKQMRPEMFRALTKEQLKGMTVYQKLVVTKDQTTVLSAEQKEALSGIKAKGELVDDHSNDDYKSESSGVAGG
ncbi:hypothetical protein LSAT2_013424 [Lamellibrachia satsuma]|nr:hypothetical protein LSAT2_013424 [Lamellibrachia satsuma]